jgi:uncharacterized tellurite resistance protein B-like protein
MSMTSTQNLHYAIGELAFAVAFSDGEVQKEEREKFENIIAAELRTKHYDFDIADIIFKILDKERLDAETAYQWAMSQIKLNSHYLSPELKQASVSIMEKIAKAFPPVTGEERNLIERFKKDIEPIVGDPVYYSGRAR